MSGRLPDVLLPLTVPASWVYERVIEARNRRYDRVVGVERLPVPVISVGNITTGGTGKTPMVMWIARTLHERGLSPAIALRGYGARPGSDQQSDEAVEYAETLPDIPLIVHPDRLAASHRHLEAHSETDCIILDDGFQHRRVHRNLDIVLLDAAAETFNERMIPAGHLREPLHNLRRADAVIVTRTPDDDSRITHLASQIERFHHRPPIAWTRHKWTALRVVRSQPGAAEVSGGPGGMEALKSDIVAPDWLAGRRVVTLLGVGNPTSVIAHLEAAGTTVAADIPAGDHERFSRAKLEVARGLCDAGAGEVALVMTEKDWVRSRDVIDWRRWRTPIVIPQLEIEFVEGREEFHQMLQAACGAASATIPD